jgi:hypothetical protein
MTACCSLGRRDAPKGRRAVDELRAPPVDATGVPYKPTLPAGLVWLSFARRT